MVTIRLTRRGGKKDPFYHVVVADSRKRQGGTIRGKETKLRLDVARIEHWAAQGARASDRVDALVAQFKKQAA